MEISAIQKMRNIVAWANYQNEGFNDMFKTFKQIEKAYDFCQEKGYEFLDFEYIRGLTKSEATEVKAFLKKIKII
jgi:hypothetical protein